MWTLDDSRAEADPIHDFNFSLETSGESMCTLNHLDWYFFVCVELLNSSLGF